MAKKAAADKDIQEIRKTLKQGNYIIGTDRGIKELKLGNIEKVFLASNCKEQTKEEAEKTAKLTKTEVITLKQPNEELGVICKKPFAISMLSITRK